MNSLDPETNVTVKWKDVKELQRTWLGFEGLKKVMEENQSDDDVYYLAEPLFKLLTELCFDGGLNATSIEIQLEKQQSGK